MPKCPVSKGGVQFCCHREYKFYNISVSFYIVNEMDYLDLYLNGWTSADFREQSTRQEWADKLGVSLKTLSRYEREVIDAADNSLLKALYWRKRRGRQKLDFYQKLILLIVKMLCCGQAYAGQKLTYDDAKEWFDQVDEQTGKQRIFSLTLTRVKDALGIV